ncbi:MAG: ornithine racemase Orr [Bacteroidota bacterium]|nr:ornithine racemase Orr [Bacteroidota bacterium]
MKYPALIIDKKKIEHNTSLLADKCRKNGINVAAVSKVFCAIPEVAQAMIDGGAYMLADSRLSHLRTLKELGVPKMLLRIPMKSRADEVVDLCDVSLNSEIDTISALSEAAIRKNKVHNIIIMTDLGDLREGVWYEYLIDFVGQVVGLKGIHIQGIGTNLTCYGGVIPDANNLGKLVELVEQIEKRYNITIETVSGGNSSSLYLVFKNEMPKRINQLRLGESIALGLETAFGERIEGTYRDAFTLALEIIELKEKPSYPHGQIGMDAFGQKPVFEDKGIRLRGILAAGRQDLNLSGIIPRDKCIKIIGGSSDHLLADFADCSHKYKVGDIVEFDLTYGGLLAASTSDYILKVIV